MTQMRFDDTYEGPPPDWDHLMPPDDPGQTEPDWDPAELLRALEPLRVTAQPIDVPPSPAEPQPVTMYEMLMEGGSLDEAALPPPMNLPLGEGLPVITVPPQAELLERAEQLNLYDACFLGLTNRDAQGQVTDYTVQCLEVYANPATAKLSGRVLDVGTYPSLEQANQQYFMLQNAVGESVPTYAVAAVGEQVTIQNGLWPQWQAATPLDLLHYQDHLRLDTPTPDIALEGMPANPTIFTPPVDLEQQQAVAALRAIGLEPPANFDLHRDSYLDAQTNSRCIAGIFQQDPADPAANCQATFVALDTAPDGGLVAEAAPVGQVGNLDQAEATWSVVQAALYQDGPDGALRAIEDLEAPAVERDGVDHTPDLAPADDWRDREPVDEPGWMDIS